MTLTRVEVQFTISRLRTALHTHNHALSTRSVEVGGFGPGCVGQLPVKFLLQLWDQRNGSINIGFTAQGIGISRVPDHLITIDGDGWMVPSLNLRGVWNVARDRHGMPVADIDQPVQFITDEIERRAS